jgi:hypothetical protein
VRVAGLVHHTHSALAQLFDDVIVRYSCSQHAGDRRPL